MDILVRYGVKPQMKRILQHYWDHLSMVDRAGRYYGTPLKVHQASLWGILYTPPYLTWWLTQ